ncbi:MAG: hypothetical protein ACKO3R_10480 [bacterium]
MSFKKEILVNAILGNTQARIKVQGSQYGYVMCGTSKDSEPNDRGLGVNDANETCSKLGVVVLEAQETNHWGFWNRRQTSILQKDGSVHVWNDGAGPSGATKKSYKSLDAWIQATGKKLSENQHSEIKRIQSGS